MFGMGTGGSLMPLPPEIYSDLCRSSQPHNTYNSELLGNLFNRFDLLLTFFDSSRSSPRHISIGQLNALLHLHLRPINLFVSKVSYFFRMGYLILRMVSHLDAFSDSPFRTWLPSHAPGGTTGAPSVRPHRSSRTRCRPSQISYAHDG